MPPPISDDEIDDIDDVDVPESIPARKSTKAAKKEDPVEEMDVEEEEGDDDDGDEDEEEYQVEKILSHSFDKDGNVLYEIKWLGYEDKKDQTWEPIANLSGAKDLLKAYHEKIGGPPSPLSKSGNKNQAKSKAAPKRSTAEAFEESPAPPKKRGRKSETNGKGSELPLGLWEDDVERVTAIIEDTDLDSVKKERDLKSLKGLLQWVNGRKTEHTMEVLRQKCPQRLLDYYEQHLVFPRDAGYPTL